MCQKESWGAIFVSESLNEISACNRTYQISLLRPFQIVSYTTQAYMQDGYYSLQRRALDEVLTKERLSH